MCGNVWVYDRCFKRKRIGGQGVLAYYFRVVCVRQMPVFSPAMYATKGTMTARAVTNTYTTFI